MPEAQRVPVIASPEPCCCTRCVSFWEHGLLLGRPKIQIVDIVGHVGNSGTGVSYIVDGEAGNISESRDRAPLSSAKVGRLRPLSDSPWYFAYEIICATEDFRFSVPLKDKSFSSCSPTILKTPNEARIEKHHSDFTYPVVAVANPPLHALID